MKTIKFIASLVAIVMVTVLFVRCTEDAATPIVNYSITGTVTYPDFNGSSAPAAGPLWSTNSTEPLSCRFFRSHSGSSLNR